VVVEDGDQDVEVGEQLSERALCPEFDVEVRALAPGRERNIQRVVLGMDLVAEGLKQATQQDLTAPAGKNGKAGDEGQGTLDQFGPVLTPTGERRPEHASDRDAHE